MNREHYLELGFEQVDRNLEFLIECFAAMLGDIGQQQLADWLPWRATSPEPSTRPGAETSWPERLAQVYAISFQLLNMVEEKVAAGVRRQRERDLGMAAEHGLWGDHLRRLAAAGCTGSTIRQGLRSIRVRPTLTAHPTEAKRQSVLEQHRMLFSLLEKLDDAASSPGEWHDLREDIKTALERLWRTGDILVARPTVADERRNVLHYLREVFPRALADHDRRLRRAWREVGLESYPLTEEDLPGIHFGSWVGGDRDGHPLVTAEVTAETLAEMHQHACRLLQRRMEAVREKLSLSRWNQSPPAVLEDALNHLSRTVETAAPEIHTRYAEEPWRQLLALMECRLPYPGVAGAGCYRDARELEADLQLLEETLEAAGARRIVQSDVAPLRRLVRVFGFHLGNLDIRQNSRVHDMAVEQLLLAAGMPGKDWEHWPEAQRLDLLNRELSCPRPFLPPGASAGPEADIVLNPLRVAAQHLDRHGGAGPGRHGLGSLIVSMTRRLSDLLAVYLLARESGLAGGGPHELTCRLPVVPLFETLADLEGAPEIMREFLHHPVTRRSLMAQTTASRPEPVQEVMIGYSDSNKDSGILASQWSLHQAQGALIQVGASRGITIRFFHGRGGTISRGAGPTHRFLEALPQGSVTGEMSLTEQGETIAQKYANPVTATYNLELLLAGVTATYLRHRDAQPEEHPLRDIVDRLSRRSAAIYRDLLQHPHFLRFYREATPIDVLEQSAIGSRPSRRGGQAGLEDLRAIPWVFSWTQSRFYLPGWYGVGSALRELMESAPGDMERLRASLPEWKFLHFVLTNVETTLASTDAEIMNAYAGLVTSEEAREAVGALIAAERECTRELLEHLRGGTYQERRPWMTKTLTVRSRALRLLHFQQVDLLRHWRRHRSAGDEAAAEEVFRELLLSVNAIASGLRTTG